MKKETKEKIASLAKASFGLFGIRDVFIFGGLALIWYGLNMWIPWVATVVLGSLLFFVGVFAPGR